MAGLVSSVGLVLMLKALMHAHGQRAVFLGMTVLVTLIAADSPAADESLLDSTYHPMGFLGDVPSSAGSPPTGLPVSHYTAFESPDSPGALPSITEPNHEARTADTMLFQQGHVLSENSKSFTASDFLAEEPHPVSNPSLSPSEPVLGSSPQFEAPAKLSTDWKLTRINSAKQSSSLSSTPPRAQLQSQSNISLTPLSPSAFMRSTTPQLSLNSEQKALDTTPTALSKQQGGASEQTLAIMTSQPGQPLDPPKLAFVDFLADESYSKILDVNQLRPSSAPFQEKKTAHGINMLPNSDEILAPGYNVPFIAPQPTSPSSGPTEVSPEDFYPTNTMELDWGSGDYLETMSFLNSDGDDYSLVTKVPSDSYDPEDYTESYDTSFPSRVGISPSSLHPLHVSPSLSLMTAYSTIVPTKSIHPSLFSSTIHYTMEPAPTANSDIPDASDIDWPDAFTIQPTDVLLPDMNSLEYYTIQLTKENNSSDTGAEHRGNVTIVSISNTDVTPTSSFTNDTKSTEEESSSDLSGFELHDESTTVVTTEESPQLVNVSEPFLDPSIVPSHFFDPSSSIWGVKASPTDWSTPTLTVGLDSTALTEAVPPHSTPLLPDDVMSSSSMTDVHWFVTESFLHSTIHTTPVLTATIAFSPFPTELVTNTTAGATELTPQDSTFTTEQTRNITLVSNEPTSNVTLGPPVVLGDQGVTEDGVDIPATMTLIPTSSEANTVSAVPSTATATTASHQATTRIAATTEASTSVSIISTTSGKSTATAPTSRQYLCNADRPAYLVKMGFPSGATVGYAKSQIRDILKAEFNKSVELQVVDPPPKFVFRVVSGPVVYTAISVINALRRSGRRFLSVSPNWSTPDSKYQVHTVLQFVPSHIDVRFCNFSESIEKGLTMAFADVRRRSKESTNFTVHVSGYQKACKNRIGPPPMNGTNEHLSSASIFEHVDRMSRATDASRRLPNKVQLIAMQPMPVPPLHSPPINGKLSDTNQMNKEIQVALRHKSEIEHHRNKIRLRAKRKGHYDFPAMDDVTSGLGDMKDQDRIYQKAQIQIDKILDPDAQMPSIFMESKKSGRGRRSPKQRMKDQLNGCMMDADKDHLITEDSDAAYRKCPGVNNVAYVSDPDQGPGSPHRSPSPTDDVFLGPTSSPPGHAPPPPPYMPPQPSIEEARQQMHSLLDDAFALVSPTSQGSTAGITLPGVNSSNPPGSSPPGRGPRPWGPSYQALGPFPSRFTDLAMSPPSVQGLTPRQGLGSSYLPPGETAGHGEQLQPDSLYSSRGLYADELPSSARPRPVGGTTGAQLHHLTQVGLSSRMNGYPAGVRAAPGQNGGIGWNHYHDDNFSRTEPEKDAFLDCPDYSSSSIFQMPRGGIREPSAPPAHLDPPVVGYLSAPPPLDTSPPTHSSASLIKAIREELLRLSQKQAAMPSYHS
ncbi:UPF0606 protein [Lates japonicus]|uniref:UPF0606 protein n=1 Tax=Lates japonicus TaxID=270547 RepID=A0AAD3RA48_LATJO|nr:UPF0606 protein [Lates japonicus]